MALRNHSFVVVALIALVSAVAPADDLRGADRILCTSVQATVCSFDGDCEIGPPWKWGVPQFIEVDFRSKKLSTTQASPDRRETPFVSHERAEGLILLQGIEGGRAFSIVIHEETGDLSAAIARDQITVSVFGACTPAP